MNIQELQAAAEAILFACGEPLETARMAEALELDVECTEKLLTKLKDDLDERGSGLCVLKLGDRYQICARTEYAGMIRSVLELKKNAPLSPAAFEVLAVVAYNQPITKSYIEQVRGVDCSGVIATLCQKGLIEEKGRLELPGRPLLYGTTPEFLKCFCISALSELPELPDREGLTLPSAEQGSASEQEAAPEQSVQPELDTDTDAAESPDMDDFVVPEDGEDIYSIV
ncbi:MAG: SMC-Scp complex subunit ScpB [Oscillospiraceae bacterium]|nr:SMC-Scp complex subunit ScpB [Oscillospiraceae bacterium]